jgi:hypothetical protein
VVEIAHAIERGDLTPDPSNIEHLLARNPELAAP